MKCQAEECNGHTSPKGIRHVFTPCLGNIGIEPCSECGLFHWTNTKNPLFNRKIGSLVYLKDGKVVDDKGNEVDLEDNQL
jgi:hypothetical protein